MRQENKVARDIVKQLNLTGKNAEAVHRLISEYGIDMGRKASFTELLGYVKKMLRLL